MRPKGRALVRPKGRALVRPQDRALVRRKSELWCRLKKLEDTAYIVIPSLKIPNALYGLELDADLKPIRMSFVAAHDSPSVPS